MSSCLFSVDVEDWFHILGLSTTPPVNEWLKLPSRVERNFAMILETLALYDAHVTCFFLGWIAERFPGLVKAAASAGHEIASHGYAHQLVYSMTRQEFRRDAERSKKLLEDLGGTPVWGYRAPLFSCTKDTPWFFEELARCGYRFDSSIFPGSRWHGGIPGERLDPSVIKTSSGSIAEFPISLVSIFGKQLCFFGGGYLRLFPWPIIRPMARRVQAEGRPVMFYVHPRDFDPDQPRLPVGMVRRFKSYVGLRSAAAKLHAILQEFPVTTFRDHLGKCRL